MVPVHATVVFTQIPSTEDPRIRPFGMGMGGFQKCSVILSVVHVNGRIAALEKECAAGGNCTAGGTIHQPVLVFHQ